MIDWAQLIFTVVLGVAVVLMVMAWWIRPHITALVADRDQWKARCQTAEVMLEQADSTSVRLIDPASPDLDIFLKGSERHDK